MADDVVEDQITDLIAAYIAYLDGERPAPSLDELDADALRAARNAFRAVDAAWRSEIELPAIEDDPVALALGFVPPQDPPPSTIALSGPLVAKARRRRNLKASVVSNRLSAAGIEVDQQWLVRLERASVQEVPFEVANRLADVLGATMDALRAAGEDGDDPFTSWLYSDAFDAACAAWLSGQGGRAVPIDYASRAREQLSSAARRSSGDGEPALWVALLRAVLDEMS